MKLNLDGLLAHLKAYLAAKECSQFYGINCEKTSSHVAKLTYVRLLISFGASHHRLLYQLNIENVFLYGILDEKVYIEQPPGFVT